MKMFRKKTVVAILLLLSVYLSIEAESVKKFYFTGQTNTEKVIITVDEDRYLQKMEYMTPNRTYTYSIYDYTYENNTKYGSEMFYCSATDNSLNTTYSILLVHNEFYTDIRIGKKVLTFKDVEQFFVEE